MANISPEFVERYQIEFEKNPQSRIFAPLAEAYRQMGMLEEALRICTKGVQIHPDFAGGRVALAKILIDRKDLAGALTHLENAIRISPDNLMAHLLSGEILLELRRPKDALKAFKMVLFLNPSDQRALKAVRKWEFLSADEYDEELFKMRPVFKSEPELLEPLGPVEQAKKEAIPKLSFAWRMREIERAISLADAFTVRGELEKAQRVLGDARHKLGAAPEIDKRLTLLERRSQLEDETPSTSDFSGEIDARARKLAKLETFLRRISERRSEG